MWEKLVCTCTNKHRTNKGKERPMTLCPISSQAHHRYIRTDLCQPGWAQSHKCRQKHKTRTLKKRLPAHDPPRSVSEGTEIQWAGAKTMNNGWWASSTSPFEWRRVTCQRVGTEWKGGGGRAFQDHSRHYGMMREGIRGGKKMDLCDSEVNKYDKNRGAKGYKMYTI